MPLSFISNTEIKDSETVTGQDIREDIFNLIKSEFPGFSPESTISLNELNKYRRLYLAKLVQQERGELAMLDLDVMLAIKNNAILSENIEPEIEAKLTYGQKLADNIAEFGGSWSFIMIFFSFLLLWIAMNVWVLTAKPFDPYPFILLNLILSCLAAIQAPVIMMSQNRQEQKDRQRAEHDYLINLKAEMEIRNLQINMKNLFEIQKKQMDKLEEIRLSYLKK